MCCWFLLRVRILCVHCYCFGILIAHLWASAYPNGSLDIYNVRVILFVLHVCVYGFLLCFWRQQVTVHMHKKRYMCVIHSWCVWVVIHVCCTLIEIDVLASLPCQSLCVYMWCQCVFLLHNTVYANREMSQTYVLIHMHAMFLFMWHVHTWVYVLHVYFHT